VGRSREGGKGRNQLTEEKCVKHTRPTDILRSVDRRVPTYPSDKVCGRQHSVIFSSFSNNESAKLITLARFQALTAPRKSSGKRLSSGSLISVNRLKAVVNAI
jgi:hypothetical protein